MVSNRAALTRCLLVLALGGFWLAQGCDRAEAEPGPEPFEIVPGSFEVSPSNTDAGAHADLSVSVEFAHDEGGHAFDDLRTAIFELPAGFVGNTQAVPACSQAEFLTGGQVPACPPASQVGTISFKGFVVSVPVEADLPLYILASADPGVPAELGFRFASFGQRMPLSVRPRDGGLTIGVRDASYNFETGELSIGIWGVPADPSHDPERGHLCVDLGGALTCEGGGQAAGVPPRPFLANPTGCGPALAEMRANSWEDPQNWSTATADAGPIDDCGAVGFEPTMEAAATSTTVESPSAFVASLQSPSDWTDPDGRISSALRSARIALPQGFSLDPSFAAGLVACTAAQLADEVAGPAADGGCPAASVVGSVEASTPILDEPARGSLYLTEPADSPGGLRLAVHAVAEAPSAGLRIELPIRLDLDPRDGRPTAVIEDAPQLPFERLAVSFGSGASGPFVTPPLCGRFAAEAELAPFSAPAHPRRLEYAAAVDRGASGGPCPSPGSLPFHPRFAAASTRAEAGARSPFRLRVSREDGEARLGAFAFRLPAGLSADLAATEVCPDQALAGADPSCPEGSLLGRTLIEAGIGPDPAALPGQVHLAGPYAGAPLSVALVTPALLGPFDLGTIVVRAPVRLDSRTGALVVAADALPTSIDGVPLRLRSVAIDLDRPGLLRNPTSCRALTASAVVAGAGDGGEPRSVALSSPYRVAGCRRLRFSPSLGLRFLGAAARNGHPGLRAVLVSHPDEAALERARITLPPDLLLDPARIGALCGHRRSASRPCSARAVVGRVRATSPLLREPLRGRLHLRRNPKAPLPDLVADLRNREVDLEVGARLRIGPSGLSLVVEDAPDLPISKLALVVAGGERGLLVRSTGLCRGSRRLEVRMVGHNGKVRTLRARLPAHCPARGGGQGPRGAR